MCHITLDQVSPSHSAALTLAFVRMSYSCCTSNTAYISVISADDSNSQEILMITAIHLEPKISQFLTAFGPPDPASGLDCQ